jgi:ParB family chromosome partitioning protein
MATKKLGLGRGLDALLGGVKGAKPAPPQKQEPTIPVAASELAPPTDGSLRQIPVEFIQPGKYQPRQDIRAESLEDLASSIKAQGIMQPIVVRAIGANKYEIIAGERRWRASQLAGLDKIPALVRDVPDNAAIAMALIENIQRENLNPMEEAIALKRLQDEFSLTQQEVADAVGKSRPTIANLLRLMNLHPEVRTCLEHGDIEMGHARCLLALEDQQQVTAARMVITRALSVRQTEALVRTLQKGGGKKGSQATKDTDPDIRALQDELSEKLGAEVLVEHSAKGKGRLILKYGSLDQLDGILAHIR